MILMPTGKHKYKLLEEIIFDDPGYIFELFIQEDFPIEFRSIETPLTELIETFDNMPFTIRCKRCQKIATRLCVIRETIKTIPLCDSCKPTSWLSKDVQVRYIKTYQEAITYAKYHCLGKEMERKFIRILERAKLLPRR